MVPANHLEIYNGVSKALAQWPGESLNDAARRALRGRARWLLRGRVARAVLFGPRDPWERLQRAFKLVPP